MRKPIRLLHAFLLGIMTLGVAVLGIVIYVELSSRPSAIAHAQPRGAKSSASPSDVFSAVPTEDRESLKDAVSRSVSYQINRQWLEMYRLYDNPRNIGLKEFIREMNMSIGLRSFTPTAVAFIPPSKHWSIDGCADFAWDIGDRGRIDAVITARRFSDGWRLNVVAISPRKDGPECARERE